MNKFLQTIIFFMLIGAMIAFIYSALRPAQYLAESEFLVISNNIETNCDKGLGAILARIIISEAFQDDLENIQNNENNFIVADYVKIKNYKNSNIVNIKTRGTSLAGTQKSAESIQKTILAQGHKYYSTQDKISIQTLVNSRIIRTPKVILNNALIGLMVGGIFGCVIIFATGLRLSIFTENKKTKIIYEKLKEKKVKYDANKDDDYTTIIKKRLEKELSKEPMEDLNLVEEGYVFEKTTKNYQEKKIIKKIGQKLTVNRDTGRKRITKETNNQKHAFEVRVIAASTMIVGKHNKKIKEDKVPENLPIFVKEGLSTQVDKQKDIITKGDSDKKTKSDDLEIIKKKEVTNQSKIDHQIEKITLVDKNNFSKVKPSIKNKSLVNTPSAKKASAHDIANGFAPDLENENGPSNEEIKDRLNRLLRGEL
jgi:capsular polysaccharide biosynthesis protein